MIESTTNKYFSLLSPEKIFLFFAITWGSIMLFLVPPFQVPDEPAHFFRSYQVVQFRFIPEKKNNGLGGTIPESLFKLMGATSIRTGHRDEKFTAEMLYNAFKINLEPGKEVFIGFPNTALYSPAAYFPQAVGIFIGKLFHLPPLILLYLARLCNLLAYTLIVYFALAAIPCKKWLFVVLALTPMSMHLAASASVDAFLNALSFLFIARVFRLAYLETAHLNNKEMLTLIALLIFIAMSKNIYVILVLLFLVIPISKAANFKKYLQYGALLFGSSLVLFIVSFLFVNQLVGSIDPIEEFYGKSDLIPKINPAKQIGFVLSDFPGFLKILYSSYRTLWQSVSESYIGYLAWFELRLSGYYYLFTFLFFFLLAIFGGDSYVKMRFLDRIVMIAIFTLAVFAFSFTIFCSWTEPGSTMITNLQGRYFIPVVPLAFRAIGVNRYRISQNVVRFAAILWILITIFVTLQTVGNRFY